MISYLEGKVKFKGKDHLVIFTSGVGYKVFVPLDIAVNSKVDSTLSLFIFPYIKEDAFDLYGFSKREDLFLFEMFISVSGIGPKIALGVFSNGTSSKIKQAVVKGDVSFFTSVPRLGKKNAQKLIIELRPKLGSLEEIDLAEESEETKEIVEALKQFGFKVKEAKEAVRATRDIEGSISDKIKEALKYLGKRK